MLPEATRARECALGRTSRRSETLDALRCVQMRCIYARTTHAALLSPRTAAHCARFAHSLSLKHPPSAFPVHGGQGLVWFEVDWAPHRPLLLLGRVGVRARPSKGLALCVLGRVNRCRACLHCMPRAVPIRGFNSPFTIIQSFNLCSEASRDKRLLVL